MRFTLEVVCVPVTDVDRAKAFYAEKVGFDVDFDTDAGTVRVVQLTPPGSGCSIQIGTGITTMTPGSLEGLQLVVADLDAAHRMLIDRGVEVSDIQVYDRDGLRAREPDDDLNNVGLCFFADPDGNRWVIQQISSREL
jgi:catechol 2,3-dioxygenase-like lactoylglutathione lyase family enzyme